MAEQSIVEQRRLFREGFKKRMQNLADIGESAAEKGVGIATGIAKEEVFGIPGMFADLSGLAQYVTNPFTYGTNEALQKASEDLIDDLGASALAAKAGVELSDEMFDEEGELRPEMIGRMLAPGALYAKGAALIPELSSGVQSLVRGLRNEGFFPAGGPQPATVSGPSFMTQVPDDAGPRSMVVRSESQEPPTGGTAPEKPLVSTERDEMLVSPENEGIIKETKFTGVKKKRETGVSDTGLYHPLFAAMQNALQDFLKDGMPAAKLLERLRGQPRAGTQIRSIGLDKILEPMGNDRVTREQLAGIMAGINPQFKTKVVLSNGGEYALEDGSTQTLPPTRTDFSSLQRQQVALPTDVVTTNKTQENYGVLLFGDEQSYVDGTYLKNLGHNYFNAQLPGFFGHVRFSIQQIPDPSGSGRFIKVALIEEIQSDAVKLFQKAEREGKVPSRAQVEKQLRASDTGLLDEGEDISDLVDARMEELQKEADDRVSRLLGGSRFYGPEEKLTNSFLDLSPEFQKFIELEEVRELATNSDKILQSEGFQLIQNQLDGLNYNASFRNNATVHENSADIIKFFLINGLHKANSEAEVKSMIEALSKNRRGVNNLPAVMGSNNPESQLNAVEILELRTDQLVKEWEKIQKKAEQEAVKIKENEPGKTGIGALIEKVTGPTGTSKIDMTELRRQAGAGNLRTDLQLKHVAMAGNSVTRRFDDALLNARTKPYEEVDVTNLSPDEKTEAGARFGSSEKGMVPHYTKTKMDGYVYAEDESSPLHETYGSLRKRLSMNEVRNAVGPEIDDFLNNSIESLRMELDNLEQLDPVFEGVGRYYGSKGDPGEVMQNAYRRDVLRAIGGDVGLNQQKAKLHRDSVIAEVEEAKANMPTDDEMLKASKSVLENPVVGPLFRRRFSLDESVTPEAVVAAPNVRSLGDPSRTSTVNLLNQPPFRDQNEFMQFAVRNIPVEMKKLGVDGVVFPRAEEFISARSSETMRPGDLEKYKVFLDKEARIGAAVQKLQRMKTDDDLISKVELDELGVTNILEELGALDSVISNNMVDEFRSGTGGIDRKELIEKIKSLMSKRDLADSAYTKLTGDPSSVSSDRARRVRGHMQNYGQSLDAGLKKLKMPIIELETLNVLDTSERLPQYRVARQVGGYPATLPQNTSITVAKDKYILGDDVPAEQRRRPVEIPKYRFIDLREGKPGADVAKKVPSAYNKGGHVDIRGGIGAMAREVM